MAIAHKNKTFATLLAAVFGGLGLHRFYLRGASDVWGWIHLASLPLSLLLTAAKPEAQRFFTFTPFGLSILAGFLQALVLGLTPDEKWDARFNPGSGRRSESRWPLALLLVLTMGVGAVALIAAISRLFDLWFTGGAYG